MVGAQDGDRVARRERGWGLQKLRTRWKCIQRHGRKGKSAARECSLCVKFSRKCIHYPPLYANFRRRKKLLVDEN